MHRNKRARILILSALAAGGIAVAALLGLRVLAADPVPHTFSSGTLISSAQVNENFANLVSQLAALESQLAAVQAQTVPAGTIVAFGGDTPPAGWLLCDGTQVLEFNYPDLAAALQKTGDPADGYVWGSTGTGVFNLPDLRGRFLRGVDGGSGNDPDAGGRGPAQNGGNTGNNVGSLQMDEYGRHRHPPEGIEIGSYWGSDITSGSYARVSNFDSTGPYLSLANFTGFAGGLETRPKNAYVTYIIKY